MAQSHTYVLLVGINKYPSHLPQLEGCIHDLHALKRFLFKRISPELLHIEVLRDQSATKANLVEKFSKHLSKANRNDNVLFYFSGYGSQEPIEPLQGTEDSAAYQDTLVCYDSRLPNGMDLAYKELHTLMDGIARNGAHICTIFDCSHTQPAQRSLANDAPALFWTRSLARSQQIRSLDSYILPSNRSIDRSTQPDISRLFPSARHVALSGTQAHGQAKEVLIEGRKRGVFTYCLLEILSYGKGLVSYSDVIRRLDSLQTQRTYNQIPQLYVTHPEDIHLPFLGQELPESGEFFQLSFSGTKGWIIDGGFNQGLKEPSAESSSTLLGIYEETGTEDLSAKRIGQVAISQVFPEESTIALNGILELNATQTYQARIEKKPTKRLGLCIRGDSAEGKLQAQQVFAQENTHAFLEKVDIREIAHFNLIAKLDIHKYTRKPGFAALPGYVITRSSDRDDQTIATHIEGFGLKEAGKALSFLGKIIWWKKLVELHNIGSRLPSEVAQLKLIHSTEDVPLVEKAPYTFSYFDADPQSSPPQFRVKISHTYHQKLYCVLIYLSSEYGIQTRLLGEKGRWLEPGEQVWALNGQILTAKVSENQTAWDIWHIQERFKLIVGTHEFDIDHFTQEGISHDSIEKADSSPKTVEIRPIRQENEVNFDWTSNELCLTVYKKP